MRSKGDFCLFGFGFKERDSRAILQTKYSSRQVEFDNAKRENIYRWKFLGSSAQAEERLAFDRSWDTVTFLRNKRRQNMIYTEAKKKKK